MFIVLVLDVSRPSFVTMNLAKVAPFPCIYETFGVKKAKRKQFSWYNLEKELEGEGVIGQYFCRCIAILSASNSLKWKSRLLVNLANTKFTTSFLKYGYWSNPNNDNQYSKVLLDILSIEKTIYTCLIKLICVLLETVWIFLKSFFKSFIGLFWFSFRSIFLFLFVT